MPRPNLREGDRCRIVNTREGCSKVDYSLSHDHEGQTCRDFTQRGECRLRAKCAFMHATFEKKNEQKDPYAYSDDNAKAKNNRRKGGEKSRRKNWKPDAEGKMRGKLRALRSNCKNEVGNLDRRGLEEFFQTTYELLAAQLGTVQAAVQLLASEGGLKRMKELLDNFTNGTCSQDSKQGLIHGAVAPFLDFITSPDVAKSSLLHGDVDRIYSTISGDESGSQSLGFLRSIANISLTNQLMSFWHLWRPFQRLSARDLR